MSHFRSP